MANADTVTANLPQFLFVAAVLLGSMVGHRGGIVCLKSGDHSTCELVAACCDHETESAIESGGCHTVEARPEENCASCINIPGNLLQGRQFKQGADEQLSVTAPVDLPTVWLLRPVVPDRASPGSSPVFTSPPLHESIIILC